MGLNAFEPDNCNIKPRHLSYYTISSPSVISLFSHCSFGFNLTFFKRFYRQMQIVFPRLCSISTLLFFSILILVLCEQAVGYFIGLVPSQYYMALGKKDFDQFMYLTLKALALVLTMALILALKKYVWMLFYIKSRKMLTDYLQQLYLADINYYKLNVLDNEIDNVDQRIAKDVDKMCLIFGEIIPDLLISPFNIIFYSVQCWLVIGWIGPISVYIFFIISTVINNFLMSPIVRLAAQQEQLEGDFRFKHMQLRLNSESAAFYRCGLTENSKLSEKFNFLLQMQKKLNGRQFFLSISIFSASYFGSVLSYLVVAFPIFGGVYDHLDQTEISVLISKASFLILSLIFNFTRIINMAPQVSEMAGCTHRVGQLLEKLQFLVAEEKAERGDDEGIVIIINEDDDDDDGSDKDVSSSPTYNPTLSSTPGLHLEFNLGCNVIITGDSGIGKTSLLRTMDGLWPLCHGKIQRFMSHGRDGVFYLPQKPYLTNGTLRQQVCIHVCIVFPDLTCSMDDDREIVKNLQLAGLEELLERTGSLDARVDWHWEDILSPGEAQRLAFVRLFYHRPSVAILDEATSQVTESLEVCLYENCRRLNMTLISIGHRTTLTRFHDLELRLQGNGIW
ncbi:hypothetical protein HELRODRAFT_75595, partial [Helobdella robusta]|uniref:ABC transmembrane type-1 domain-containing protein n=1 Tax=Helobdella robusta TaxID=6412 RepID=T1G268_HELRO